MNRSCKERETINRTTKIEPLEYTGLISQNAYKKSKSRERRRSTVIDKVKEISGLDTFDKALNGKLFFIGPSYPWTFQWTVRLQFRCPLVGRCFKTSYSTSLSCFQPDFLADSVFPKIRWLPTFGRRLQTVRLKVVLILLTDLEKRINNK